MYRLLLERPTSWAASLYFSSCSSRSVIKASRAFLKASVPTFSIGSEKPFRIFFTRLRRHAPCGVREGMATDDRGVARRAKPGLLRLSSARLRQDAIFAGLLIGRVAGTLNGKSKPKKAGIPCFKANKKNKLRTLQHAQSQIQRPASTYFVTSVPVSHMGKSP